MDTRIETIKLFAGSAVSAIMAVLGSDYKLIVLLLVVMVIDTIFGHLRAIKNKNWKSYNARWGMIGKLVELTLVALMYLCQWTFGVDWIVNVVVTYFLICEGASIVENIVQGHLNENVPSEVEELLQSIKKNGVTGIVKKLSEFLGGGGKK